MVFLQTKRSIPDTVYCHVLVVLPMINVRGSTFPGDDIRSGMRCKEDIGETPHLGKRPESMEISRCHQPDLCLFGAGGVGDSFLE